MKPTQSPPGNTSLRDSVRQICQQPELEPEKLQDLLQLQDELLGAEPGHSFDKPDPSTETNVADKKTVSLFDWIKSPVSGWVASAVIVIGLAIVTFQPNNYSEEIAYEVVKNHLKLKPLDVQTNTMADIQGYFTQLDFSPARSSLLETTLKLPEKFMLGGRYCSIKGVTAAQLRYRKNDIQTLYQVPYDEALHGDIADIQQQPEPQTLQLKGLEVQLWREHGLLMVLVKKP
ncbi:hypothetical protein [Bacterioplanoides sp.]|uniref:hypothetical protein n=1 Tax=Bacterioplanoides sp. TaxID=2066072 RepID=UPI003B595E89